MDLDAHSYPQVKSFWKRDENWVEGAVDDDGYDVSTLKWPAGKKSYKWKGWEFSKKLEGVSHFRFNFYLKLKKPVEAEGDRWGVKILDSFYG